MTPEQRPPVNNGHCFWVPRVVVAEMFGCPCECTVKHTKHVSKHKFSYLLKDYSRKVSNVTIKDCGTSKYRLL